MGHGDGICGGVCARPKPAVAPLECRLRCMNKSNIVCEIIFDIVFLDHSHGYPKIATLTLIESLCVRE